MPWPLSQDYNEAVQNPGVAFADPELKGGQPVLGPLGMPMPRSGNFADVYELTGASGAKWAIKCFTRQVPGLRERYFEISKHLAQAKLPFTVDFEFLLRGILIRGDWYPVLKMQWVEGLLLNEFVRDNLDKPFQLEGVTQIWIRMGNYLRRANMAHADLQHGNVILVAGSKASSLAVKLIDYDGMWVPALADKKSGEVGHPAYQHPQRLQQGTYSAEVDRLPVLAIVCALRCLAVGGKPLWDRYDNGDNLLFREADLRAPAESPLFKELRGIADPQARALVGELEKALGGKLEDVPAINSLVPETKSQSKTVPPSSKTAAPSQPASASSISSAPSPPAAGSDFQNLAGSAPEPGNARRDSGWPLWAMIGGGAAAALVLFAVVIAIIIGAVIATSPDVLVAQDGKKDAKTDSKTQNKDKLKGNTQGKEKKDKDKGQDKDGVQLKDKDGVLPKDKIGVKPPPDPLADKDVAELIAALDNADPKARRDAARVLGQRGPLAVSAVPRLVELVADSKEPSDLRVFSISALLGIGNIPATRDRIPTLVAVMADPQQPGEVRQFLVNLITLFNNHGPTMEAAKADLEKVCREPVSAKNREVRHRCAMLLASTWKDQAPSAALDVFEEWLRDPTAKTMQGEVLTGDRRTMAIDSLRRVGWKTVAARKDIVDQLTLLAAGENETPVLRTTAERFLKDLEAGSGITVAAPDPKKTAEFTPLFNGKDLTGWEWHKGKKGNFQIADEILTIVEKPPSILWTEREYGDFHLRMEARIEKDAKATLHFRWHPSTNHGYDMELAHGPLGPLASAIGPVRGIAKKDETSTDISYIGVAAPSRPGEWVKIEFVAQGTRVKLIIDGKTMADYEDQKKASMTGLIGIKTRASTVEFRKIEIKELKPADDKKDAAALEQAKIQGVWTTSKGELRVVFKDGRFTFEGFGKTVVVGKYTLRPELNPRGLDIDITEGPKKGLAETIYRLKPVDRLDLVLPDVRPARPTEFAPGTYMELERAPAPKK
jgi:uncharacterized protein (TIGR03067 family)